MASVGKRRAVIVTCFIIFSDSVKELRGREEGWAWGQRYVLWKCSETARCSSTIISASTQDTRTGPASKGESDKASI